MVLYLVIQMVTQYILYNDYKTFTPALSMYIDVYCAPTSITVILLERHRHSRLSTYQMRCFNQQSCFIWVSSGYVHKS